MLVDQGCWERGCACYDDRIDKNGVEVINKKWVGLTDEEVKECCESWYWKCAEYQSFEDFLRSVEAKLKEKNGGNQ